MASNDNRKKIFEFLNKSGYSNIKSEQDLDDALDTVKGRQSVYNALRSERVNDFSDYATFENLIGGRATYLDSKERDQRKERSVIQAPPTTQKSFSFADLQRLNNMPDEAKQAWLEDSYKPENERQWTKRIQPTESELHHQMLEQGKKNAQAGYDQAHEQLRIARQRQEEKDEQELAELKQGNWLQRNILYPLARTAVAQAKSIMAVTGSEIGAENERKTVDTYVQAQTQLENAERQLNEAERTDKGGALSQIGRGIRDKSADISTWDFGATDLSLANKMLTIKDKLDSGKELSQDEKTLLQSYELGNYINGVARENIGGWYKAGEVTAESVPFMVEMFANPLSGTGKALAKGVAKKGVKKVAARVAGDLLGATGMTLTTGALMTSADAKMRQLGEYDPETGKFEDGKDAGQAYREAILAGVIERESEMVGDYFAPVGQAVGRSGARLLDKVGLDIINDKITSFATSKAVQGLSSFTSKVQWHGVLGEWAEEMIGGTANALLVGDQTIDQVYSKQNMIDTAMGLLPTSGFFAGTQMIGYGAERTKLQRAKTKYEGEIIKAVGDVKGKQIINTFGGKIDADNAREVFHAIANDESISTENKHLIASYLDHRLYQTGFERAEKYRGQVSDEYKQELDDNMNAGFEAFEKWADNPERVTDVFSELDDTELEVAQALGVESGRVDDLLSMYGDYTQGRESAIAMLDKISKMGVSEEALQLVADRYIPARTRANGVLAEIKIKATDEAINVAEEDLRTRHEETGQVVSTVGRDGTNGYIIRGNVRFDEEGNIDRSNSDKEFFVRDGVTGEMRMLSLTDLDAAAIDPNKPTAEQVQEEAYMGAYNGYMSRLANQMAEREAQRQVEAPIAPEEVQKEEVQTEEVQPLTQTETTEEQLPADLQIGEVVTLTDTEGNSREVTVNSEVDMEGNVMVESEQGVEAIPAQVLMQAKQAQTNTAEAQAKEDIAAEQTQAYPTDKEGNIAYEEIDEAPVVAQAIEEEFGEKEAYDIVDGMVMDTQREITNIEKSKKPAIQKAREKKALQARLGRYNEARTILREKRDGVRQEQDEARRQAQLQAKEQRKAEAQQAMQEQIEAETEAPTTTEVENEAPVAETEVATKEAIDEATLQENPIERKWATAKKTYGNTDKRTRPDGSQVEGRWVLVEADAITPSHDPRTFTLSEGFPTTQDGRTINDNDYQDPNARENVERIAQSYDARALEDTPIVGNGYVYSGNNRTMSGQIAHEMGTDGAYLQALPAKAKEKGIDPRAIQGMKAPRLVFELNNPAPLTSAEMANYNRSDKKTKNNQQTAIGISKRISPETTRKIASVVGEAESLGELNQDRQVVADIFNLLKAEGHITQEEQNQYFNQDSSLNGAGKDFINSILLGTVLSETAIRQLNSEDMHQARAQVMNALVPLIQNKALGDNSMIGELTEAIDLLYNANEQGDSLERHLLAIDFFENKEHSTNTAILAKILDGVKGKNLRQFTVDMNSYLRNAGVMDMFTSEPASKETMFENNQAANQIKAQMFEGIEAEQEEARNVAELARKRGEALGYDADQTKLEQDIRNEVARLEKKYGVKVNIHKDTSTITDKKAVEAIEKGYTVKGWFSPKDGEVNIYLPHTDSVQDVIETYFHEVIGHKGMRQFVGDEQLNSFLEKVYELMNEEERAYVAQYEDKYEGIEEFIAELAERGNFENGSHEQTLWDKIVEMLSKLFSSLEPQLEPKTATELAERVLADSAKMLREERTKVVEDFAKDADIRFRLSTGNQELEETKSRSESNGTFMKAPNGQPTNLNERQWLQVRTDAFKNWFGDWENDPQNASKVVDENGEPMVIDELFINDNGDFITEINKKLKRAEKLVEEIRAFEEKHNIDWYNQPYNLIYNLSEEDNKEWERLVFYTEGSKYEYMDKLVRDIYDGITPELVVAFRYGYIRDNGASFNYRDQEFEYGVSVVDRVKNLNTNRSFFYDEIWGKDNDYNIVVGLYTGRHGADGEILLSAAQLLSPADNISKKAKSATENSGEFSRENDDIRFRLGDNSETNTLNSKQKRVGQKEVVSDADVLFRVSKRVNQTIDGWLRKREDLTDDERAAFLDYIKDFDNAKALATGKWFANGVIRLPEDQAKVDDAMEIAKKAKVDALQYKSPMELLDAHEEYSVTEERINPDDVAELSNKRAWGNSDYDITVYDVKDSKTGQKAMREIINTHYGKDANPWCLLQGDGEGNLTKDSWNHWKAYKSVQKKVAFKDGKLIAFYAGNNYAEGWWDRMDVSFNGVPITKKIENDSLGRSSSFEIYDNGEEKQAGNSYRGNKQNGVYEEWYEDGRQSIYRTYKNGVEHGISKEWYDDYYTITNCKDGRRNGTEKVHYNNGTLKRLSTYKDGKLIGVTRTWYDNGQLESEQSYNNDNKDGLSRAWYDNGQLMIEESYDNGHLRGLRRTWYKNGQLKREATLNDWGLLDGLYRKWDIDGRLIEHSIYDNGQNVKDLPLDEGVRFRLSTGNQELDNKLGMSLYKINKDAKRFRDLKSLFYDNHHDIFGVKEVYEALDELGKIPDNWYCDDSGIIYSNEVRLDKLDDDLEWCEGELRATEYRLEENENEEDVEEIEYDINYFKNEISKIEDDLDAYKEINSKAMNLFDHRMKNLYSLKEKLIESLAQNGSADGMHAFQRGDVRYLYRLGDFSFHSSDISDTITDEEFSKLEQIDEISSEYKLGEDIAIEEAISNIEDYLNDDSTDKGVRFRIGDNHQTSLLNSKQKQVGQKKVVGEEDMRFRKSVRERKESSDRFIDSIANKSLPEVIGTEQYENFLEKSYYLLSSDSKAEVDGKVNRGATRGQATVEQLTKLANTKDLSYVATLLRSAIAKSNGDLGFNLTDKDIQFALAMNHSNTNNGGVIAEANRIAKRRELGVDNQVRLPETSVRFRMSSPAYASAIEEYNKRMEKDSTKFLQEWQDGTISVRIGQEAISRESGKPVKDFEDVHTQMNQKGSRDMAESEEYKKKYIDKIIDLVAKMEEGGIDQQGVDTYLMAKHGLERNRYIAFSKLVDDLPRDRRPQVYQEAADKIKPYKEDYRAGKISYADYLNAMEDVYGEVIGNKNSYQKMREQDYSGLSSLFGDEQAYEKLATETIEQVEEKLPTETKQLLEATRNATQATLKKNYQTGLMNKKTLDFISEMYEHYVPLRDWKEDTAKDVYEYYNTRPNVQGGKTKKAGGRTSQAESPLAMIYVMAYSTIQVGNRNRVKQALYYLGLNHKSPLLTTSKAWYRKVNVAGEETLELALPEIPQDREISPTELQDIISNFEEEMKELSKEGKATQSVDELNLPVRATSQEQAQHAVLLKINGEQRVVYVNGNPRLAQAVNMLTNAEKNQDAYERTMHKIKRWQSAVLTSKNLEFIPSNFSRDVIDAMLTISSREDKEYSRKFKGNLMKLMLSKDSQVFGLLKRHENGTLDLNNDVDRYFDEFIKNGGETGYSSIVDIKDAEKEFKRELKKRTANLKNGKEKIEANALVAIDAVGDWVEFANRGAETISRFATYMTSRQNGRTIQQSVANAKDVTVNFNTKGSQEGLAKHANLWYIFLNPAIQGLANKYESFKRAPRKATINLLVKTFVTGMVMPFLTQMLINLIGDDDDKEAYQKLSPWVRRNNIVLYAGGNTFLTIPLGHEVRVLHGLGTMLADRMMGYKLEKPAEDMLGMLTSMLPIDPTSNGGDPFISLTPSVLQPLAQAHFNKDFTGAPLYKDGDYIEKQGRPAHTIVYKSTSKWLTDISKAVNTLSGGNDYKQGWVEKIPLVGDLNNPAISEHILKSYLGGIYTLTGKVADTVTMLAEQDPADWDMRNVPVASRFIKQSSGRTADANNYNRYKMYQDEATKTKYKLNNYNEEVGKGNEKYRDLRDELLKSVEYKRWYTFEGYDKPIRSITRAINELEEAGNEEQAKLLKEKRSELQKQLVEELEKIK